MEAPQNPAGAFALEDQIGPQRRAELIADLANAPSALRAAVAGLSASQLDVRYRNWTLRQIVHHLADSNLNCYIRFKWTLTEEGPTIKPYDEGRWAALPDARIGEVGSSIALMEGLHARWVQLLNALTEQEFARSFMHPETGKSVSLNEALSYYAWHGKHHTAQILWARQRHGR